SYVFGVVCCVYFFFFSSRRRHTRLVSDWSSDVCSSDLLEAVVAEPAQYDRIGVEVAQCHGFGNEPGFAAFRFIVPKDVRLEVPRSEERRVGKEWRARWETDDEKENRRKEVGKRS